MGALLENDLPTAFLGYRSSWGVIPLGEHRLGLGAVGSIALIFAGASLIRRNLLWGLLVIITLASLWILGPIPRYFLMILPLLLAGWALLVHRIAERRGTSRMKTLVICLGLGTVLAINLTATGDFLLTQWGFTRPFDEQRQWQGFHRVGFLRAYHAGYWAPIYDMAATLRKQTRPDDKIIGPEATILTYLSDRQVYPPMVLLKPASIAPIYRGAFFPIAQGTPMFRDYDVPIQSLMATGKIGRGEAIGKPVGGYQLAEMMVGEPREIQTSYK